MGRMGSPNGAVAMRLLPMLLLLIRMDPAAAFAPRPMRADVPSHQLRPASMASPAAVSTHSCRSPPIVNMARLGPGGGGFDPRSLVGPVVLVSLFASGAIGWIFNGILFLAFIPLIAGPLVSWYLENNLLEGACPECGVPIQVLKGQRGSCMTCGATTSSNLYNGVFTREGSAASEDGVVEIDVIVDDK